MKMNPEYKKWKDAQSGGPPSKPSNPQALPIVSNMDDHMQMNEDYGEDILLAESTNATIEMMQEPEISLQAGTCCAVIQEKIMNTRKLFLNFLSPPLSLYFFYFDRNATR
jgi:hypothetical protein